MSEEIVPEAETGNPWAMALGQPGLPARFTWRGRQYTVLEVIHSWKGSSPEGGRPGTEKYVRRHWYEIKTSSGEIMVIYCQRQGRRGSKSRWWLYKLVT